MIFIFRVQDGSQICQHHPLNPAAALMSHDAVCVCFQSDPTLFKVRYCKLILLSKQTSETTAWSRVIAVASERGGAADRGPHTG